MVDVMGFLTKNKNKVLTIRIWLYSGYYRFCIRFIPMKFLRKYFGVENEESDMEIPDQDYQYIKSVAYHVNRSANKTPWESKCLVRALTARHVLKQRGINSTLFLGVGKEQERMIAHAWVRVGKWYITGGNGENYTIVAKYKSF